MGAATISRTSLQTQPIVPNGTLYYCTGLQPSVRPRPRERRGALVLRSRHAQQGRSTGPTRGCVAGWPGGRTSAAAPDATCRERIYTATLDSELIALDAATGEPCADFGEGGRVSLRDGLADAPDWEYYTTSPPSGARWQGGGRCALVADNLRVDAPSGVVRAFDARSGALAWAFDPVPPGFDPRRSARREPATRPARPNVWADALGRSRARPGLRSDRQCGARPGGRGA